MAHERPNDHHFVPVFYLRKWIVPPATKLVEYTSRAHGPVTPRWTGPKGTGYEQRLYDARDDLTTSLEEEVFQPVDAQAAVAMGTFFGSGKSVDWTRSRRSAWSRFLMSMMMRHPADLATFRRTMQDDWLNLNEEMREAYTRGRTSDQPETAEEWWEENRAAFMETAVMRTLRILIDHRNIGVSLNGMIWTATNVGMSRYPLLTSDRPVLVHGPLDSADAFLMMPSSPDRLFIAVRCQETLKRITDLEVEDLVLEINAEVVKWAERFVYASNMSQTVLVQARFGQDRVHTLMKRLEERRAADRASLLPPTRVPG